MITAFFIGILKILTVSILLAAMVMVLMGITHVSHVDDDAREEDTRKLKQEVDEDANVVGAYSVFHRFLAREKRPHRHHKVNRQKF